MTPIAAIDIGTNSILLLIARKQGTGLEAITDLARTARLGEDLAQTGVLKDEAMERAIAILQDYASILATHNVTEITCFGTAALRRAGNAREFCDRVQQTFGWPIRVLSGQEEALYTFKGVMSSAQANPASPQVDDSAIAIDIGGGSTEVIAGSADTITFEQSIPVGAVVLKDQFAIPGQIDAALQQAIATHLQSQFADVPQGTNTTVLVTGGTATTLAALELKLTTYDVKRIDGHPLTQNCIEAVFRQLNGMTKKERTKIPGMEAGRADIILPALLILRFLCDRLKTQTMTVTVRGARYGILLMGEVAA